MTNTAPPKLLTAEEYAELSDDGRRTELVKGVVVEMPQPKPLHGYYCMNIGFILRTHLLTHDLGRVVSNDSGVITERGPDTMRGTDIAFYSYNLVPRGPMPNTYWPPPELVFEVKSPSNSILDMTNKANEYLAAGVVIVCVLDPETESLGVFTRDEFPRRYSNGDELSLPGVLPDFRVPVRQFFA